MALDINQLNHILTLLEVSTRQAREVMNLLMHNQHKADAAPAVAVASAVRPDGSMQFQDPKGALVAMIQNQGAMLNAQLSATVEHAKHLVSIVETSNADEERKKPRLVKT